MAGMRCFRCEQISDPFGVWALNQKAATTTDEAASHPQIWFKR
jgi:hypothetical protein